MANDDSSKASMRSLFDDVADSDEAAAQEPSACDDPEFSRMEAPAIEQGKIVAAADANAEQEMAKLIPMLARLRDHKSIRGRDHQRGQRNVGQKWGDYLEEFRVRTGIKRCSRTITRQLDEFSAANSEKKPDDRMQKAPKPAKKSTKKPDKSDVSEPVSPSDQDEQASHRIDASSANFECPSEVVSTEHTSDAILHHGEEPDWSSDAGHGEGECALKPGNRSALTECVILNCDLQFNAVLAGLPPSEKAKILDYLTKHLVQRYLGADRGDGEIKAGVEYIPAAPPRLRKEWIC
jgi:hypothetical protein